VTEPMSKAQQLTIALKAEQATNKTLKGEVAWLEEWKGTIERLAGTHGWPGWESDIPLNEWLSNELAKPRGDQEIVRRLERLSAVVFARSEGQAAALAGATMGACPYTDDAELSHHWLEGWRFVYLQALCQYLRATIRLVERHFSRELIAPQIILDEASRATYLPPAAWELIRSTYEASAAAVLTWGSFDAPPDLQPLVDDPTAESEPVPPSTALAA
jgi:ribosome modulation factor